MEKNMKKILDSIHGNIYIPKGYVTDFIDTEYFQRLRRIEQTSCRSVFPSARHDRFIHSLGVFHLGTRFVQSIKSNPEFEMPKNAEEVFNSYTIACLLHDVGHSPFSHTFENAYEKETSLTDELTKIFNNETFSFDIQNATDMKPHEKMSALIAVKNFKKEIEKYGGNTELVVRMIIGCSFTTDSHYSFENSMIQLIHGDIIDADRLDYAMRDVWAAGYNTSTINVDRLIDNTIIEKGEDGLYKVCYSSKALNEIESVLNVKSFQNLYVFSHHQIVYEQEILKESMKSASEYHWYGTITEDKEIREQALGYTCNIQSMFTPVTCEKSQYSILHPMDDDFVAMMKYCIDDFYIKQWFSREYSLKPLWKSKAEFYYIFGEILNEIEDNTQRNAILEWLGNGVRNDLKKEFSLNDKDLLVIPQKVKYSELDPKQIIIKIGKNSIPLSNLSHDRISANGNQSPFSYIYINKEKKDSELLIGFIKNRISEMIKSEILI